MAVAGASAFSIFNSDVRTIGTSWTFAKVQEFANPQNLLAVPLLRYISDSDDETVTKSRVLAPLTANPPTVTPTRPIDSKTLPELLEPKIPLMRPNFYRPANRRVGIFGSISSETPNPAAFTGGSTCYLC
jgi:hypothetical protein